MQNCPNIEGNNVTLDELDLKILDLLQTDAALTVAEIADRVGLSKNPCWRRIRAMEDGGYIRGRVAVLDRARMNVGQTVFVAIRAGRHNVDWLAKFERAVEGIQEIIGAYRLSGDTDYLLHIVVPDIEAYDGVYKRLIARCDFESVSSSFVMEELKQTSALPLDYLDVRQRRG